MNVSSRVAELVADKVKFHQARPPDFKHSSHVLIFKLVVLLRLLIRFNLPLLNSHRALSNFPFYLRFFALTFQGRKTIIQSLAWIAIIHAVVLASSTLIWYVNVNS